MSDKDKIVELQVRPPQPPTQEEISYTGVAKSSTNKVTKKNKTNEGEGYNRTAPAPIPTKDGPKDGKVPSPPRPTVSS